MKQLRRIVTGYAVVGTLFGAARTVVGYVQARHLMSIDAWFLLVFVLSAVSVGVYLTVDFLRDLSRRVIGLETGLSGIRAETKKALDFEATNRVAGDDALGRRVNHVESHLKLV